MLFGGLEKHEPAETGHRFRGERNRELLAVPTPGVDDVCFLVVAVGVAIRKWLVGNMSSRYL